jgi:alginate O-acetyltransferase complex protein AlgI
MIFTGYSYVFFLIIVICLYWTIQTEWRKPLLIVASFIFYCSWKWEYGFLLAGIGVFNWAYGRWVVGQKKMNGRLWPGIFVNIGILLIFKYTRFIFVNLSYVFSLFNGRAIRIPEIILPLGISFFTFQGVAYLVDVSSGERPFMKFKDFILYKAFWPQLIAGPIIRPREIHSQIEEEKKWSNDNFIYGLKRILNGFLKKVVLADSISPIVDLVFLPSSRPGPVDIIVGVLGFGLQIYFDFSAYSDIAIGTARLFGYTFPENFNWPYLAAHPRDFWNRWHMTLSRWIKDYLFTPLAFSFRGRRALLPLAVIMAMSLCGLWHGAAWTFVVWGIWHGFLLIAGEMIFGPPGGSSSHPKKIWAKLAGWSFTMSGVFVGWMLFRAQSLHQVGELFKSFFSVSLFKPQVVRENMIISVGLILLGTVVIHIVKIADWRARSPVPKLWYILRPIMIPLFYALAITLIVITDQGSKAFVYFQF